MAKKRANILSSVQIRTVLSHLKNGRNTTRNRVIFLLSVEAGLRAKEIAGLTWHAVMNTYGEIGDEIVLKHFSAKQYRETRLKISAPLKNALLELRKEIRTEGHSSTIVKTERSSSTSAAVIVNLICSWYVALGFEGCSSHSGRRTFILNSAVNISRSGGTLKDVQTIARHSFQSTTKECCGLTSRKRRSGP